uniref:Uncharacterized protein n=1 Tax=Megaselia scalaris TaxID=36166 RepID=T1H2D4_MEGSC
MICYKSQAIRDHASLEVMSISFIGNLFNNFKLMKIRKIGEVETHYRFATTGIIFFSRGAYIELNFMTETFLGFHIREKWRHIISGALTTTPPKVLEAILYPVTVKGMSTR